MKEKKMNLLNEMRGNSKNNDSPISRARLVDSFIDFWQRRAEVVKPVNSLWLLLHLRGEDDEYQWGEVAND